MESSLAPLVDPFVPLVSLFALILQIHLNMTQPKSREHGPRMGPAASPAPSNLLSVLMKLVTFSIFIIGFPILTFYMSYVGKLTGFWSGLNLELTDANRATYSGGLAVLVANLFVIAFIVVAVVEEPANANKKKKE